MSTSIVPYSYKRGLMRFLTAERQENIDSLDDLSAEDWAALVALGAEDSMLISEDSGTVYAYASTPTAATEITMTAGSTSATVEPTGSAAFALTFNLPLLPATDSNFLFRVDYDKGTHGAALVIGGETVTGSGILHFVWSGTAWVVFSGSTAMTVPESTTFVTHTIVDGDSGNTLALTLPTGATNIGRVLTLVIASTTSGGTASKTNIIGVYGGTITDAANGTYLFRCTAEGVWTSESADYYVALLQAYVGTYAGGSDISTELAAALVDIGTYAGGSDISTELAAALADIGTYAGGSDISTELAAALVDIGTYAGGSDISTELAAALVDIGTYAGGSDISTELAAALADIGTYAGGSDISTELAAALADIGTYAGGSDISTELAAAVAEHALDSVDLTIVGTLPENTLAHYDEANEQHEVAQAGSSTVVGANNSGGALTDETGAVKQRGKVTLKAFSPIAVGQKLKAYHTGYAGLALTNEMTEVESFTAAAGAFTNQPTDDAVELVSDSASDTAVDVKIYGHDAGVIKSETKTLTGTVAVETTEQHWDDIVAVFVTSGTLVGTLTVRKKTGPATICTIAPAGTDAGVVEAADESEALQYCHKPIVVADGACTEYVVVIGTDNDGAAQEEILQMNGTTNVDCANNYSTIDRICVGGLATVTASVLRNDTADYRVLVVGQAMEAATGKDDTFSALLT